MSQWVRFADRLPTQADADGKHEVLLCEENGNRKRGLWDWIPPERPDAKKLWAANGFVAWKSRSPE